MTKKIFRSVMIASSLLILITLTLITFYLYEYFTGIQETQLRDELSLAKSGVENLGESYLETLRPVNYRITHVDKTGTVLYDTKKNASKMKNHADRKEIKTALLTGASTSERYSETLMEETIYFAEKLSDGTVLRISVSRNTVISLIIGMLQPVMVIFITVMILMSLLAKKISENLVRPLNTLNLDKPLENEAYEELAPLLERINKQHKQIESQIKELKQRKEEFDEITGNMKEGLVLLNLDGKILSINNAARKLFNTDKNAVGKNFLTIERNLDILNAIKRAEERGHSEMMTDIKNRAYQFDISRTLNDDGVHGTAILILDRTEQASAEKNRREFTANVSHELKTPLQSIMGRAELMEKGIVKKEDIPRFISDIRFETARLVRMIDEIIGLSFLDEKKDMPVENTDVYRIIEEICTNLKEETQKKHITLNLSGTHVTFTSIKRLIFEISSNLINNAVKYNKENGKVDVEISEDEQNAYIVVSDTGIGIPVEEQKRIFERFYRVDKSHSKATGGTGLGLSIVKHAVETLSGNIRIYSRPNLGTRIKITLPKNKFENVN